MLGCCFRTSGKYRAERMVSVLCGGLFVPSSTVTLGGGWGGGVPYPEALSAELGNGMAGS